MTACVLYCIIFRELGSLTRTVDPFGITEEDSEGNLKPKILFHYSEENFLLQKFEWLCLAQCGESSSADYPAALSHPFLKRTGGKSRNKKVVGWDKEENMTYQLPSEKAEVEEN